MRKQTVSYVPLSLKMHMFNNESTNVKKFVKIVCDILSVSNTAAKDKTYCTQPQADYYWRCKAFK